MFGNLSVMGSSCATSCVTSPHAAPLTVVVDRRDQCETPHYWEMIRRNADRMPMEWRQPGIVYGVLPSFI